MKTHFLIKLDGSSKNLYFQEIKGLCIILVVLIHLPFGWSDKGDIFLWIAVRKIINFPVAMFFFLSAYYSYTYDRIKGNIGAFYKKRIKRLLYPYLCWSILYVFIMPIIRTGRVPDNWSFLLATGYGPTYFLLALLQFTILHPLIQKYKYNSICNIIFSSITFLYIAFYYIYNFKTGNEFKPEQFFCFPWFIFYYLGVKLQQKERIYCNGDIVKLLGLIILSLVVSQIEAFYIYYKTGILSFAISQITFGSIIYSVLVIATLFQFRIDTAKPSILSKLGDYSMGIFLSQMFFIWIYRVVLTKFFNYFIDVNSIYNYVCLNILMLFLVISTSYFFSKITSYYLPKISMILGLK